MYIYTHLFDPAITALDYVMHDNSLSRLELSNVIHKYIPMIIVADMYRWNNKFLG